MRFRSHRSILDMMFTVRRLQELGRKAHVSLSLCFIDLQKAYDSVDRTFLGQVLARFGLPPQLIRVVCPFQDGMRGTAARMRAGSVAFKHILRCDTTRCPRSVRTRIFSPISSI